MSFLKRNWLGIGLIFIGLGCLAFNVIISFSGEKYNNELMENFQWGDSVVDSQVEQGNIGGDGSGGSTDVVAPVDKNSFTDNVVAIVDIPSIKVKYPVCRGTDVNTLKRSLGYFEDTALPGQVGNFAVAGHRNSSYARYFNRLDEVKVGDEIIIETKDSIYKYIVTESFIIHESDTSVLKQGDSKEITLITCTNGFKPTKRIVVKGILS